MQIVAEYDEARREIAFASDAGERRYRMRKLDGAKLMFFAMKYLTDARLPDGELTSGPEYGERTEFTFIPSPSASN